MSGREDERYLGWTDVQTVASSTRLSVLFVRRGGMSSVPDDKASHISTGTSAIETFQSSTQL